jgi:ribosomal protein L9
VLLEDVPGLGSQGDIVLSDLSRARNYLVPFKKAYYVPRVKGKPILPDDWTPPARETEEELEMITPAIVHVPYVESMEMNTQQQREIFMTDQDIRNKLATTTLVFQRVLIHQDTDKIFGSVNALDVAEELKEQFGIELEKEAIDCRLKTIGNHQVNVKVGDASVQLAIVINPQ